MANGFIRQPNQLAAVQADLAAANEELTKARLRERNLESRLFALSQQIEDEDAECPECEDICALQQACDDADMDVLLANDMLVNEFGDCTYWANKFACSGLTEEYQCVTDLVDYAVRERRYQFAIAAHNLEYCRARHAPEMIECTKSKLLELLEANPETDPRCLAQINKALACVCA